MKLYPFILFFLLGPCAAFAQTLPAIQTDRPDQTECPFIVPKNHVQIESGFSYEKESKNIRSYLYPSVLWKFGLNERLEFRLITELQSVKLKDSLVNGLNPVTIGFKVRLAEERGIIPLTSFIGHLTGPDWGSKEFKTSYFAPAFRFTMQHTLSKKIALAYNLGAEWNGESAEPTFIYTLTTGFSITEKFGAYTELYGFVPQIEKADHRADAGFTYLLSDNLMIDLSGGIGLSKNAPKFYIAFGFSCRFNTSNK